jgi:glycosyltransferase involved in cell wall biosynthesis
VHDVLFIEHPEWFTKQELAYFRAIPGGVRRARWVLTSSRSEADRITRLVKPHALPVAVGLGIDAALLSSTAQPVSALDSGRYLLSVGRLNARKNLARLISATRASSTIRTDFPLAVVGKPDGKDAELGADGTSPSEDAVIWLGTVSPSELNWLYSNAAAMVYPSLDEGYGLPPVEAAVFGSPVAVSDIPVMRENLGDFAHYFDPYSQGSIAEQVGQAVRDGRSNRPNLVPTQWDDVVARIRQALSTGAPSIR